jgi:hypothetical protein
LLGLFLLFANEPELNLFVVHTEGEHGKRPPLPAAVVMVLYAKP